MSIAYTLLYDVHPIFMYANYVIDNIYELIYDNGHRKDITTFEKALPVLQNGCLEFSIKSSKNQEVTDYPSSPQT